jgi:hypothetical protein
MYKLCFVVAILVGCKEKPDAKPAAPAPAPIEATQPAPAPSLAPAEPAAPPAPAPAPPAAAQVLPAGGFRTAAEYEAKAIELLDKLTQVFARGGTNCDKLADGIELFVADHQSELANTGAFEVANPGVQDALEAKMQDKAKRFMQHASASLQACQAHRGVKDALAKLPD